MVDERQLGYPATETSAEKFMKGIEIERLRKMIKKVDKVEARKIKGKEHIQKAVIQQRAAQIRQKMQEKLKTLEKVIKKK